ncbi:MAG: heavy-metal-associated domain-containing protein [Paracoccaceae bacterium]
MTKLNVTEMSCNCCKSSIEKVLADIDVGARITADLESRVVSIETEAFAAVLTGALNEKCYEAKVA